MGQDRDRTRRRFGALVGLVVAGTAGCLGDGDSDDPDDSVGADDGGNDSGSDNTTDGDSQSGDTTDDPEAEASAVVGEFYSRAEMIESEDDIDDYIDSIAELVHSVSPVPEFYRTLAESEESELTVTVYESVETAVIAADLGGEAIRDRFFLARDVPEEDLETVAGENLVVEATLSGGTSALDGTSTEDGDEEQTTEWLVAPEEGDWLIVF